MGWLLSEHNHHHPMIALFNFHGFAIRCKSFFIENHAKIHRSPWCRRLCGHTMRQIAEFLLEKLYPHPLTVQIWKNHYKLQSSVCVSKFWRKTSSVPLRPFHSRATFPSSPTPAARCAPPFRPCCLQPKLIFTLSCSKFRKFHNL